MTQEYSRTIYLRRLLRKVDQQPSHRAAHSLLILPQASALLSPMALFAFASSQSAKHSASRGSPLTFLHCWQCMYKQDSFSLPSPYMLLHADMKSAKPASRVTLHSQSLLLYSSHFAANIRCASVRCIGGAVDVVKKAPIVTRTSTATMTMTRVVIEICIIHHHFFLYPKILS